MSIKSTFNLSSNINTLLEPGLDLATADASSDYVIKFNFPIKTVELQVQWTGNTGTGGLVEIWDRNDPSMGYYEYVNTDVSPNIPLAIDSSTSGNQKVLLWQFCGSDALIRVTKGSMTAGTVGLALGVRSM